MVVFISGAHDSSYAVEDFGMFIVQNFPVLTYKDEVFLGAASWYETDNGKMKASKSWQQLHLFLSEGDAGLGKTWEDEEDTFTCNGTKIIHF